MADGGGGGHALGGREGGREGYVACICCRRKQTLEVAESFSIKAVLRPYQSCIKAVLRLY
jgi:hypothetical protein